MANHSEISREDEQMELPPGFRFHPTDEELITHYLSHKVLNSNFSAIAIGEVDFNKVEPWDLPMKAKMGVKEWYFFCVKDRKYPTGLRTNRATESGYWKATGKDKEIFKAKALIGMKKTLVFYSGRAPKGEKTNWVMHEYRLEGKYLNSNITKKAKEEWVLARVVDKSSSGKKPNIPGFVSLQELQPPYLPPLIDCSIYNSEMKAPLNAKPSHVTCFSNHPTAVVEQKATTTTTTQTQGDAADVINTTNFTSPFSFHSKSSFQNSLSEQSVEDFQYMDSFSMQDQSFLRHLLEAKGSNMTYISKGELPQETGFSIGDINTDVAPASHHYHMAQNNAATTEFDCLWGYLQ